MLPADGGLMAAALGDRGFEYLTIRSFPWVLRVVPAVPERVLSYQRDNADAVTNLVELIGECKIDLVVTNSIVNPWGAVAANITGIPHAWLVREFGDLDHGLSFQFGVDQTWRDISLMSDLVVANSEAIRDHIEHYTPGTRAMVSYPSVRLAAGSAGHAIDSSPESGRLPLRVIALGTLSESKGQSIAIAAAGILHRAGRPVELRLVGAESPNGYREVLRKQAADLGISESVVFVEAVSDVDSLIAKSDVGLTLSRMEAFGRVTAEYMLQGRPVIGTRTGGTTELIESGVTGYLVPLQSPDDVAIALGAYDENRALLATHGHAGRARVLGLLEGDRSLDSLVEALVALPGRTTAQRATPALLLSQMADAGKTIAATRERERAIFESREYRIGAAVLAPFRIASRARSAFARFAPARVGAAIQPSGPPAVASAAALRPAMSMPKKAPFGFVRLAVMAKNIVVAAALMRRGLFSRSYYERQAERQFVTDLGASYHFASVGIHNSLAPSPSFEPEWASAISGKTPLEALRFVVLKGAINLGRKWAPPGLDTSNPLCPRADIDTRALLESFAPGSDRYQNPQDYFELDQRFAEGRLGRAASNVISGLDWNELSAGTSQRDESLVSVLMLTFNEWTKTAVAINAVLAHSGDQRVEVVLVDNGSRASVRRILRAVFAGVSNVSIVCLPINLNFAAGSNVAFAHSRGSRVVLLNNDTEVRSGWLEPLLGGLVQPGVLGVQPLLIYGHGTVQTAGTVFGGKTTLPRHFLADHAIEDARALPPRALTGFSAVTAACVAMRASDFAQVQGFDELFVNGMEDVDLCLRMTTELGGDFSVAVSSEVLHYESLSAGRGKRTVQNRTRFWRRWVGSMPPSDDWRFESLGFSPVGVDPRDAKRGEVGMTWGSNTVLAKSVSPTRLPRVALRCPVIGTAHQLGQVDAPLFAGLRTGLERSGAMVIVDRPSTRFRRSRGLDDVVIHFSVDARPSVQPGAVNVLVQTESGPPDSQFELFCDLVLRTELSTSAEGLAEYSLSTDSWASLISLVRDQVTAEQRDLLPSL